MPDPAGWLTFALASLVLTVVPGPAVMFVLARGLDLGRRGALLSAAGLAAGNALWAVAAGLGVASAVAASGAAYRVLTWAGAGYLAWLGLRRLLRPAPPADAELALATGASSRAFWQGVVVNALNPKIAVFFVAFLPPFLDPARGSVSVQGFVLGATFALIGWATDSVYALAAGSRGHDRLAGFGAGWPGRVVLGGTYLGLAAVTLLAGHT